MKTRKHKKSWPIAQRAVKKVRLSFARRSTHISNNIIPPSSYLVLLQKGKKRQTAKKLSDSAAAFDVAIKLIFKVNTELFKDAVALKSGDKI